MVITRIRRRDSGTVSANNAPRQWTRSVTFRPDGVFLLEVLLEVRLIRKVWSRLAFDGCGKGARR